MDAQKRPWAPSSAQERPGECSRALGNSREHPGACRSASAQKHTGALRSARGQEHSGALRSAQERPRAPRSFQQEHSEAPRSAQLSAQKRTGVRRSA